MASLFENPQWTKNPQPVGLELSRTHCDIPYAQKDSAILQSGSQAVPQFRKLVSLQAVGPVAPTGPAVEDSFETMIKPIMTEIPTLPQLEGSYNGNS